MPGFGTDLTNVPSIEHVQVGPAAEQSMSMIVMRPLDLMLTEPPHVQGAT